MANPAKVFRRRSIAGAQNAFGSARDLALCARSSAASRAIFRRAILPAFAIAIACEPASAAKATQANPATAESAAQLPSASPSGVPAQASPPPANPAGPADRSAPPAAEARVFLNKAIAYHRDAADLSLSFSASVYDAALDKRDEYKGRLLLKGKDRFRLEIPGGTYVSDGTAYWEYHARTRQALRKDAADRAGQPLPADVLLRFLDSDPLSAGPIREDGKEWIGMRLDPGRAMKNLDSLEVLLDKSSFALHRVSSRDVAGNEARYTVTSVKRNSGLKDKAFAFAPPEGVEVVDMRGE